MHVITYSPNFAPPHFTARSFPKNTPHDTMESHTTNIYMLSVYHFRMELFPFSLYAKRTLLHGLIFFFKLLKRLGNAVPVGKLPFLSVRLGDVNVPISWHTKFRRKFSCLFPCAVEGGWFVRSYKMKQFTRHTFRIKYNINFRHFFWRSDDTTVLAFLITYIHNSQMFRVIYDGFGHAISMSSLHFPVSLVTESSVRWSEFVERRRTTRLSNFATAVTP